MTDSKQGGEMEELKPCPFCGGPVKAAYTGSSDWEFECQSPANVCGASTTFWVRAENEPKAAAERWNRRTPSPEGLT